MVGARPRTRRESLGVNSNVSNAQEHFIGHNNLLRPLVDEDEVHEEDEEEESESNSEEDEAFNALPEREKFLRWIQEEKGSIE